MNIYSLQPIIVSIRPICAIIVIEDRLYSDMGRDLLIIIESSKLAANVIQDRRTQKRDEAQKMRARTHLSSFLQFVHSLSSAEEEEDERYW